MKKLSLTLLLGLALIGAPQQAGAEPIRLTAAAGPVAGTSYVGLGALCKLITNAHPDANVNLIPGSDVSNPMRIQNREANPPWTARSRSGSPWATSFPLPICAPKRC